MVALPLKLPQAAAAQLQALADRLQASRGAVARALLLRGLAELERAAAPLEASPPLPVVLID